MIREALALTALAVLGFWFLGGLLLRLAGLLAILAGLGATALGGGPAGFLLAAVGVPLWLLGHWIYRARHGAYRSHLAGFLLAWRPPGSSRSGGGEGERPRFGGARHRGISARLDFPRRAEVTRRRPDH